MNFPGYARRALHEAQRACRGFRPGQAQTSPTAQADAALFQLTGISGDKGGGRPTPELIKQTILPKCVQVPKRRCPWSARARQHGPRAAGRRLTDDVSDRTGGDPRRQRRAPEDGGQRQKPRPLGRRPRHGGPAAYGGPLLEDGVVGLPRKQETSGRIF